MKKGGTAREGTGQAEARVITSVVTHYNIWEGLDEQNGALRRRSCMDLGDTASVGFRRAG